ncbi:MAG: hypothetical protein IMZ50_16475 [Candidatus Atribacteria bacterium]|nr:hypothetical protein [Candidatus Atribacteria bacterium]
MSETSRYVLTIRKEFSKEDAEMWGFADAYQAGWTNEDIVEMLQEDLYAATIEGGATWTIERSGNEKG